MSTDYLEPNVSVRAYLYILYDIFIIPDMVQAWMIKFFHGYKI